MFCLVNRDFFKSAVLFDCGSLNENDPHTLICLIVWSLVCGTVLGRVKRYSTRSRFGFLSEDAQYLAVFVLLVLNNVSSH